ncbi:DUF6484 domain-containing protein [Roseateles amylovorans]|uniref:DUF6484 domain-containing protein n=1 Tax=Roseateles amylovorans TaxID=2978473 RepID=A0ABY6B779_9BURK|nr:DUF6484 domain-containing protein [Roseateles amylovorans]UXH80621.1 DUF6484 domain-containing protein [Roseateles amylovorans]
MKRSVSQAEPTSAPQNDPGSELLQQMLEGRTLTEPQLINGVVVGELAGQTPDGDALISVTSMGLNARVARCAAIVDLSQFGLAVAVSFEQGNPHKPIIMGVMQPQPQRPNGSVSGVPVEASVDRKRRVVIQADEEIELRCGDSAIVMTSDGRIHLRGQNITSEADMSQRILGASVSVN